MKLGLAQWTQIRDFCPRNDAVKMKLMVTARQMTLLASVDEVLTDAALYQTRQRSQTSVLVLHDCQSFH